MNLEHATPELFAALAKAQGEIENASKNAANPHFRSKYADLAEVLNTIRPPFTANGLSLTQFPSFDGALASVTTIIGHASGGYLTAVASCVPAKTDAQGIGAATTYLRRYGAAAAAGIAQEDDDGQSAAHNGKPTPVSTIDARPTLGVWESLDADTQIGLQKIAINVRKHLDAGNPIEAHHTIEREQLPADEKVGLWTLFNSKERSALTKASQQIKANKEAA